MKYHHGGIQSPISTQSTPPPQLAPPPPQFGPQCPCPGPGIPGILGQCGLASATPAPSPRAVKPTIPDVAATTTIFLRFILHPGAIAYLSDAPLGPLALQEHRHSRRGGVGRTASAPRTALLLVA